MWRRRTTIAAVAAGLAALSGCGQSAQVTLQQREIAYQTRVGEIDKPFARPATDPAGAAGMLRHAIAGYEALDAPGPVRKLNAQVIRGLKGELRAYEAALSKTAGAGQIHSAEALGARSRADVSIALVRMAKIIGTCRANAANC
jgi:hypothetical protein